MCGPGPRSSQVPPMTQIPVLVGPSWYCVVLYCRLRASCVVRLALCVRSIDRAAG